MRTLSNPQPFSIAGHRNGQTFRTFSTQAGTPIDLALGDAADLLCAAASDLNALMAENVGETIWSRLALIRHAIEAAEGVCRDGYESLNDPDVGGAACPS